MSSKKSKKKNSSKGFGDVTLNDFANSAVCKNRPKKSNENVAVVLRTLEEEKGWDEKDDQEFEGDFVEELTDDGSISYVIRTTAPRRKRATVTSEDNVETSGKDYPIDIWYVLSEYISPEDVGIFASICRTSYEVVSSAKFWYSLYKRFCKNVSHLPRDLKPDYIVRKFCLRTSVIRALHCLYPPFIARRRRQTYLHHPRVLERMQCISIWHRGYDKFDYYFKLQQKNVSSNVQSRNFLETLDDIFANRDEHCRVLKVTLSHFVAIPPVLGHTLTSVGFTLCQGVSMHRLQMGFTTGVHSHSSAIDGVGSTNIVLEPVINVTILDWWHPLYPHSNNMEHLLNQE